MKKSILIAVTTAILSTISIVNTSALNYQQNLDMSFTFDEVLSVSLSSPNLVINNLTPGTASDSNIVTVTVLSNNPYGYTLTSNVGNDTTYNTDQLVHASFATATPFSTITAGTTVADLNSFTNNRWGYSYSTDGGTSWTTEGGTAGYSGLPLYSVGEATLLEKSSTSAVAGDNIQFKIAAKADATQLAGEYRNIINFMAVGEAGPSDPCASAIRYFIVRWLSN